MTQSVRTRAIPVLAYSTSDAASPGSCTLVFKYNGARSQASLTLQLSLLISGYDVDQLFTLQYDADNITTSSLGPATIPLPQTRLDAIARQGNPQIRTLFLNFKETCPLWCPPSAGLLSPTPGAYSVFSTLANLAKATSVNIVFDYNWLHRDYKSIFQRFVDQPETLTGYPNQFADRYRRADWTVFSPFSHTEGDQVLVETDEAPPSYVEPSQKRPRNVSTSPPSSPERKRIFLSAADLPTSPTEKASTTSSPDHKPPRSLSPSAQDLEKVVEQTIAMLLPGALESILPGLLPRIFVDNMSSPSPSMASSHSDNGSLTVVPPAAPLSSLGATLSEHVAKQVESQLHSIYNQTLSHAAYLRNAADVEFFEALEDHKVDLLLVKQDSLAELEREAVDRLEVLREDAGDVVEEVGEWIGDLACETFDGTRHKMDKLRNVEKEKVSLALRRGQEDLRRERGWLGWEREVFERDRRKVEARTSRSEGRACRAGSAPPCT